MTKTNVNLVSIFCKNKKIEIKLGDHNLEGNR